MVDITMKFLLSESSYGGGKTGGLYIGGIVVTKMTKEQADDYGKNVNKKMAFGFNVVQNS